MPTFRDLVTAVVYSYITCEFHYAMTLAFQHLEVLCYKGLYIGKTLIDISAKILIFLSCCLFYCPIAFQLDPKPFKRVVAFQVS